MSLQFLLPNTCILLLCAILAWLGLRRRWVVAAKAIAFGGWIATSLVTWNSLRVTQSKVVSAALCDFGGLERNIADGIDSEYGAIRCGAYFWLLSAIITLAVYLLCRRTAGIQASNLPIAASAIVVTGIGVSGLALWLTTDTVGLVFRLGAKSFDAYPATVAQWSAWFRIAALMSTIVIIGIAICSRRYLAPVNNTQVWLSLAACLSIWITVAVMQNQRRASIVKERPKVLGHFSRSPETVTTVFRKQESGFDCGELLILDSKFGPADSTLLGYRLKTTWPVKSLAFCVYISELAKCTTVRSVLGSVVEAGTQDIQLVTVDRKSRATPLFGPVCEWNASMLTLRLSKAEGLECPPFKDATDTLRQLAEASSASLRVGP